MKSAPAVLILIFLVSCAGTRIHTDDNAKKGRMILERHQVSIKWSDRVFVLEGALVRMPDGAFVLNALNPAGPLLFTVCMDSSGRFGGKNHVSILVDKLNPLWVAYDIQRMLYPGCKKTGPDSSCSYNDPLIGEMIVRDHLSESGFLSKRTFFSGNNADPSITVSYKDWKRDSLGEYAQHVVLEHEIHEYEINVSVVERTEYTGRAVLPDECGLK